MLADVVERSGRRFGFPVGYAEREALAVSVASWRPFPDTVRALRALEARYRLAIISNIDDDLFKTTVPQLGVFFDCVVTAQAARCYKPDQAIFELALGRLGVKRASGRPCRRGRYRNLARTAAWLRDRLGAPARPLLPAADRGARPRSA